MFEFVFYWFHTICHLVWRSKENCGFVGFVCVSMCVLVVAVVVVFLAFFSFPCENSLRLSAGSSTGWLKAT